MRIKSGALNYRAFLDRVEEKRSLSDRMNLDGYVLVEGDITNIEKYVHLADLNMYTNKRLLNG